MDEQWNRLANAILMQAIRDWKLNVKELKNKKHQDLAMRELKLIIDFIISDWFLYLTSGHSPQMDCSKRLISQVKEASLKKELLDYLNEKWEKYIKESKYGH